MLKRITGIAILLLCLLFDVSCGFFIDVERINTNQTNGLSSDATLSGLQIISGADSLLTNFSASLTSYSLAVKNNITSVTVTPTANGNNSTISVNNIHVTSGNSSGTIYLVEGTNNLVVNVKAQNGTSNNYVITITRQPIRANLSDLVISSCHLSPAFDQYITSYIVYAHNISSITITPTAAVPGATITVNEETVSSGSPSSVITLNSGSHPDNITNISIHVTSADLTLTKEYSIKVYYFTYSPDLVGHWLLNDSIVNSINDVPGVFMGTWQGGTPDLSPLEYVTEGLRTGLHFRYTANGLNVIDGQLVDANNNPINEAVSGNWLDCEYNAIQPELNIEDYITVSFWLFWDTDLMKDYKGAAIPEENILPSENLDNIMNIISKAVFWNHGWQIRYDQSPSASIVYLYVHNYGHQEKIPIIENFSRFRNQWVHISVTIDNVNNEVFTYVNGVATNSSPQTYNVSFLPISEDFVNWTGVYTGHFAIGAFSHPWGGYTFNGKISDVQLYHGIINSHQAYSLYNSGSITSP